MMVVSLCSNHPAQFDPEPYSIDIRTTSKKVLISIRKINLVAIHPTVKTVGFLAESCNTERINLRFAHPFINGVGLPAHIVKIYLAILPNNWFV